MATTIEKYFPQLSVAQRERFDIMLRLYPEWNSRINVISRQDIDNLETHHLLHSLAIAKFLNFAANSRVLDLGTGGGLPGLPLGHFSAGAFPLDRPNRQENPRCYGGGA